MKRLFVYFVYLAITWPWDTGSKHPCGGDLQFSPIGAVNTTRNCPVSFECQSNNSCAKDISYNEVNDSQNATPIKKKTCPVKNPTTLECPKAFLSDSYVWCIGPSKYGRKISNDAQISVLDHLTEVQNMDKNDTDCIVWTPPHTDIELQYSIGFMYYNGKVIDSTTSNLTEYCLTNITFDECKLVSVSVVAKAVCGDASSNISWWNGTILRPSQTKFNVSLAMVENGVAIDILYTFNKTCLSVRASAAELSCHYCNELEGPDKTYQLTINRLRDLVHLVLHNTGESVLLPNKMAKCNLTLCNEAGQTEHKIEMFSTFPVQEFNISNKTDKTHICMEYQFLNGSTADCRVTLNNTENHFPFELNGSKTEECHSTLSLPDGLYDYCVTCDEVDHCIMEGGPVNITHHGSSKLDSDTDDTALAAGLVPAGISVLCIVAGVIIGVIYCRKSKSTNC